MFVVCDDYIYTAILNTSEKMLVFALFAIL